MPVTVALCGLCLGLFAATVGLCAAGEGGSAVLWHSLWSTGSCRSTLLHLGALELARVWIDGQWWRLGTTVLLHGSWLHALLNVASLWVVGELAERAWGSRRTGAIFAVAALGGCAGSLVHAEAPMVVGASGGVIGLAGAILVARLWGVGRVRRHVDVVSPRGLGVCLAVMVAVGFVVPLIAQAGHIGGLLAGAGLGWAWRGAKGWGSWAGVLAVAGAIGGALWLGRAPSWRPGFDEWSGYRLLERGEPEAAWIRLDAALEARPGDPALANGVAYSLAEAGMDLDRAEGLVREALEPEPDNADYLDTLGWVLCKRGDVAGGLQALARAEEAAEEEIPEIGLHRERCGTFHVER